MNDFFIAMSIAILLFSLIAVVRVVIGPGILNRVVGVNVIGTKTMGLILFMGFIFDKIDFFIDIALVYALINFIGTLAITKYFERRGFLGKEGSR